MVKEVVVEKAHSGAGRPLAHGVGLLSGTRKNACQREGSESAKLGGRGVTRCGLVGVGVGKKLAVG